MSSWKYVSEVDIGFQYIEGLFIYLFLVKVKKMPSKTSLPIYFLIYDTCNIQGIEKCSQILQVFLQVQNMTL